MRFQWEWEWAWGFWACRALNLQFTNGNGRKESFAAPHGQTPNTHLQNQLNGNGSNNTPNRKCVMLKCNAAATAKQCQL